MATVPYCSNFDGRSFRLDRRRWYYKKEKMFRPSEVRGFLSFRAGRDGKLQRNPFLTPPTGPWEVAKALLFFTSFPYLYLKNKPKVYVDRKK